MNLHDKCFLFSLKKSTHTHTYYSHRRAQSLFKICLKFTHVASTSTVKMKINKRELFLNRKFFLCLMWIEGLLVDNTLIYLDAPKTHSARICVCAVGCRVSTTRRPERRWKLITARYRYVAIRAICVLMCVCVLMRTLSTIAIFSFDGRTMHWLRFFLLHCLF